MRRTASVSDSRSPALETAQALARLPLRSRGRTGRNTASGPWMAAWRPWWQNASHLFAGSGQHRPRFAPINLMATRERSFDGQRADARELRSQEAEAGKAKGDRSRAPRLGSPAESRREDIT